MGTSDKQGLTVQCMRVSRKDDAVPFPICMAPTMMMMIRASTLATVKMSCTRVAHLTLAQLINVNPAASIT